MNLLNKLTVTNLKLNKKRTTVTVIGIILATALITAVAGMVTSFRGTMVNWSRVYDGDYHYEYINVPKDELKYIENNRNVESYFITQDLGYAKLNGSNNEYKPYLYLMAYNSRALEKSGVKLVEGRMPKNDNEIVISEHIIKNGKVNYKIGDKLTLDISKRISDDYELTQDNSYVKAEEVLEKDFTKSYEIVGIIERPNKNIEPHSAPGYTVITYLDTNNLEGKANIYTRYTKTGLNNRYQVTADILEIPGDILKKNSKELLSDEEINQLEKAKYVYQENSGLLSYEALNLSESNLSMIYTLAAIVIGIIIFTSVFCIRNSFAISITEKMKQYGMLASIGATSKQIKKNVLYEALILSAIGIPIGVLSGIFAVFILLKVIGIILKESLNGLTFLFAVPWSAVALAVVLSLITIFFSARKSAKRAAKVSPIEAIRSNEDIKIKSKKVKSPKIIKKIFGVGGDIAYKNLKRNKKKYRTTVISIVVSVSIFIAMSSFMNYAFKASSIYYKTREYNLVASGDSVQDYGKLKEISKFDGIDKFSLLRYATLRVDINNIKYSEKGKKYIIDIYEEDEKPEYVDINIVSLGKEEYSRYIKELGLNEQKVKNKVILIDDMMTYISDENGKGVYQTFRIFEYKAGNQLNTQILNRKGNELKKESIEIAKVADKRPMGIENVYSDSGFIVVSDEWMDNHKESISDRLELYVHTNNADRLEENIKNNYKDNISVNNYDQMARQENALWLVIAIFLYGFIAVISLIGITNIFNTITTNMNLRSKEFANLKSIGMTKKEFNRMIRLESIFYGTKSLMIGIPIGIGLSYAIYKAFAEGAEMGFSCPVSGIVISITAVFILIIGIMKYSLNKINKQNIIETIRKDNI